MSTVKPACCHTEEADHHAHQQHAPACHDTGKKKIDYLLWTTAAIIAVLYLQQALLPASTTFASWYQTLALSIYDLTNTIWLSVIIGIVMVGLLGKIPREFVVSILGVQKGFNGILRATAAGVLLDLCSHGILMVGAKLYERGARIGQVMAFLIASPWNSFSLTLVLIALIGLPWTLAYIFLSMVIAVIAGVLFDLLVDKKVLPANPQQVDLPADFNFWSASKQGILTTRYDGKYFADLFWQGLRGSRMVLRWIFFGVILASLVRAFVSAEHFAEFFGPTFIGLMLTLIAATIIEVCSEGSTPIAADLLTRANAPGNGFAFLMTGVATDYTEVMVLKDTTKSWKIALFLPLLTVPQVLVVAWLINVFAT